MRLVCALLSLLIPIFCLAQTQLTGKVIAGDSKKSLGWVSVVVENDAHKPVAFTQTKEWYVCAENT